MIGKLLSDVNEIFTTLHYQQLPFYCFLVKILPSPLIRPTMFHDFPSLLRNPFCFNFNFIKCTIFSQSRHVILSKRLMYIERL